MLEIELYPPVKDYLEAEGYRVRGEVKNCDIAAVKDNTMLIVELKTSANMTLLIQATERQAITDLVYVAIPKPKKRGKSWSGIQRVIKRLGLGLFLVQESPLGFSVIKLFDPEGVKARKNTRKKNAVLRELSERKNIDNVGGSVRQKLMTAYKENAILIACYLTRFGASKPKLMRALGTGDKTLSILSSNHYKWFERVDRGVYALSKRGKTEVLDFPEMVKMSEAHLEEQIAKQKQ
ncbi:MAG: hypothetical protein ACI9FB_001749 [Candidatus Azotimanducaceae bacterium]|jgi:hypothetical protein